MMEKHNQIAQLTNVHMNMLGKFMLIRPKERNTKVTHVCHSQNWMEGENLLELQEVNHSHVIHFFLLLLVCFPRFNYIQ